ncbi:MAG: (2Fe-2S)-binding protein [Pirellulales bacterium]|nr:(2Fe-2S)-binding protein [Pirellulales bacterium]
MSPAYLERTDRIVCRCLRVYESDVVEAVETSQLDSLREVIRQTGAGSGCTACHHRICEYLARSGAST